MTELERDILEIIKTHIGEKNKITQKEIKNKYNNSNFNFSYGRTIDCRRTRRVILELIKQGYPIVSTPTYGGGYWWQKREEEGLKCYRRLRKQAIMLFLRARQIRNNSRVSQLELNIGGR